MKYLVLFLTLLVPCLCLAQVVTGNANATGNAAYGSASAPAAETCSTYSTTNAWDNFAEGFQIATTGFESNVSYSVWTTNGGSGASFSASADTSALTTYKPDGACNQALLWDVGTSDGVETFATCNLGGAIDLDSVQTDVYFSLYVDTVPSLSKNYQIYGYRNSASPSGTCGMSLGRNAGGTTFIQPLGTGGKQILISAGQWYVIKFSYDTAAGADGSNIAVWSNGAAVDSDVFTRTGSVDMQYLFFGAVTGLDASDDGKFYIDVLCIKTN